MYNRPQYKFVFLHKEDPFEAEIWHYEQLSSVEVGTLAIKQNSFYVQLRSSGKIILFELFIGDDLNWQASPGEEIDADIVKLLGTMIDSKSM